MRAFPSSQGSANQVLSDIDLARSRQVDEHPWFSRTCTPWDVRLALVGLARALLLPPRGPHPALGVSEVYGGLIREHRGAG